MSTAMEIRDKHRGDSTKMAEVAEKIAVDVDQDWENETTTFTFNDGSTLSMSGPSVEATDARY